MDIIDVNDIERIEVIKGAASSLYGTGAVVGVINIITKDGRHDENLYFRGTFPALIIMFVIFVALAYVRGMDTHNDLDLPFITPLCGCTGLR